MPAVARGGVDDVLSPHGNPSPRSCQTPAKYKTVRVERKVYVEGIPIVLKGDPMQAHPDPASNCGPHAPTLTTVSGKVFGPGGLGVGRVGDSYDMNGKHPIISGSSKVFFA